MKFAIFQASRQGGRPRNQDRIAYSYSREALLTVLADGMGGHQNGELAAHIAVRMMAGAFQRLALPHLIGPGQFLRETILLAHRAILDHSVEQGLLDHPRTTIVAAVVQNDKLHVAHVGDSRLYHIRAGRVIYRTEDHSKVQHLFRQGLLEKNQINSHPERSKIYNCLGGDYTPKVELSTALELQEGDTVLLCSDGLWSLFDDEELAKTLSENITSISIPALMELAETRADSNSDNRSAIAFNWGGIVSRSSVSTGTMALDAVSTIMMDPPQTGQGTDYILTGVELDATEIDLAIAEIQAALARSRK